MGVTLLCADRPTRFFRFESLETYIPEYLTIRGSERGYRPVAPLNRSATCLRRVDA